MTQEQLASARLTVRGLLESQRVHVPFPDSVDTLIDDELGYLASANVDPIPESELEALVGNICSKHLLGAFESYMAPVEMVPEATVSAHPVTIEVSEGTGKPPDKVEVLDFPAESCMVRAAQGSVVLETAGSRGSASIVLTVQAAVEAADGLAVAIDELLTPAPGFEWQDVSHETSLLWQHADGGDFKPLIGLNQRPIEGPFMAAEVRRADDGVYEVTMRIGCENPAGQSVGAASDMASGKALACARVKACLAAPAAPTPEG